jgi:CDP-glycerol glycerophosphotransferase
MGYSPDIGVFKKLDKLGLVRGKKVFLQHGIIKDNLINLYYPNIKLDLFVCGAYLEYQYVNSRFKHPQGVVKYLGLCRYDELNTPHKVNKQILTGPQGM